MNAAFLRMTKLVPVTFSSMLSLFLFASAVLSRDVVFYLLGFDDDDILLQGEKTDDNVIAVAYSVSGLD